MGPLQEHDLISILVVLIKCFWPYFKRDFHMKLFNSRYLDGQLLGFFFVLCSFYLFLIIGISLKKG